MKIYKVNVIYSHLSAQDACTVYVLAEDAETAQERAASAMRVIQGGAVSTAEYLVDRTVEWIALGAFGDLLAED